MSVLSKITRYGQITLPVSIRKKLGVTERDIVEIVVVDDKAIVVPKRLVDKSHAYFWMAGWQEGEIEAEKDVRGGRVKVFDAAKDLTRDLDR